jgi:catechol 2,3-dioxygenase-like lactoylglutathione lyase family enzyme
MGLPVSDKTNHARSGADSGQHTKGRATVDWKLEVVPISVSEVDRAKAFYAEQVGFVVDLDTRLGDEIRLVQLTPPGSGCSIHLSTGILNMPAGMLEGLQLVVSDIEAARADLVERGVEISPVQHMEEGVWVEGRGGDWNSFVFFRDPDGNGWVLQERPARA